MLLLSAETKKIVSLITHRDRFVNSDFSSLFGVLLNSVENDFKLMDVTYLLWLNEYTSSY